MFKQIRHQYKKIDILGHDTGAKLMQIAFLSSEDFFMYSTFCFTGS